MFVVLAKRTDCGDTAVFPVESGGKDFWKTRAEARAVMKEDYLRMCGDWTPDWSATGKDMRKRRITATSARFSVPVWDGERSRNSRIECRWRIIEI